MSCVFNFFFTADNHTHIFSLKKSGCIQIKLMKYVAIRVFYVAVGLRDLSSYALYLSSYVSRLIHFLLKEQHCKVC
jgi:hypothetical protein